MLRLVAIKSAFLSHRISFLANTPFKIIISVCIFVCTMISQDPTTDLPKILIWELGRATAMFLALDSKLSGLTLIAKL